MPQMAPLNWILIIILTMTILLFFKSSITKKPLHYLFQSKMKQKTNKMKW